MVIYLVNPEIVHHMFVIDAELPDGEEVRDHRGAWVFPPYAALRTIHSIDAGRDLVEDVDFHAVQVDDVDLFLDYLETFRPDGKA